MSCQTYLIMRLYLLKTIEKNYSRSTVTKKVLFGNESPNKNV